MVCIDSDGKEWLSVPDKHPVVSNADAMLRHLLAVEVEPIRSVLDLACDIDDRADDLVLSWGELVEPQDRFLVIDLFYDCLAIACCDDPGFLSSSVVEDPAPDGSLSMGLRNLGSSG